MCETIQSYYFGIKRQYFTLQLKHVSLCSFLNKYRGAYMTQKSIVDFTSDPKFKSKVVAYSSNMSYKPKAIKTVVSFSSSFFTTTDGGRR